MSLLEAMDKYRSVPYCYIYCIWLYYNGRVKYVCIAPVSKALPMLLEWLLFIIPLSLFSLSGVIGTILAFASVVAGSVLIGASGFFRVSKVG